MALDCASHLARNIVRRHNWCGTTALDSSARIEGLGGTRTTHHWQWWLDIAVRLRNRLCCRTSCASIRKQRNGRTQCLAFALSFALVALPYNFCLSAFFRPAIISATLLYSVPAPPASFSRCWTEPHSFPMATGSRPAYLYRSLHTGYTGILST